MRVSEIFMSLAVAAVVIVGAADTTVGNTCAALPVSGNGVAVMQNESGKAFCPKRAEFWNRKRNRAEFWASAEILTGR